MHLNRKAVIVLSLVLVVTAAAMFILPVSAAMNGDVLQTQDKDQLRDDSCGTCDGDCDGQQCQTRTQLRQQTRDCLCIGTVTP